MVGAVFSAAPAGAVGFVVPNEKAGVTGGTAVEAAGPF